MGKSRKPSQTEAFSAQGRNGMDAFSYYKFRKFYKDIDFSDLQPDYGVHGAGIDDLAMPKPIDLWYEKPYFGRYDLNGNPVYLLEKEPQTISRAQGGNKQFLL